MGYFKFDKIDKIVIAFTLIIVTMFCIFNTFCLASTDFLINSNVLLNYTWENIGITSLDGYNIKYWKVYTGSEYYVINNNTSYARTIYISTSIEDGSTRLNFFTLSPNSQITLDLSEYRNKYNDLFISFPYSSTATNLADNIELYSSSSYMNLALGRLASDVGVSIIWSVFEKSIPWVLVIVVFSLGVWFIKHNIIEHSKGREY